MYLFRGDFGCVLYTVDFRWESSSKATKTKKVVSLDALKNQTLDKFYLDNTCCNPQYSFPSREDVVKQVVDIITYHSDHEIVISIDSLGKEGLLLYISQALNIKIWVWPKRLWFLHLLGFHEIFTTWSSLTRVRAVARYKRGFDQNGHAKAVLVNFYGSCWGSYVANTAFDETSDHTSLLWIEAILVALRNAEWFQGVDILQRMQVSYMQVNNNAFTIAWVLQACGQIGALDEGKQIHGYILRNGTESNLLLCNSLIYMYTKNGSFALARGVFDPMKNRNLSMWNSIISGHAVHGYLEDAWELLHKMETYNLKLDIVTWNTLLLGNLHHGLYQEVLKVLPHVQNTGFKPNNRSINTVHCSCMVDLLGRVSMLNALFQMAELKKGTVRVTFDPYSEHNDTELWEVFDPRGRGSFSGGDSVMALYGVNCGGDDVKKKGSMLVEIGIELVKSVKKGLKYIGRKYSPFDPRGRGSYQRRGIVMTQREEDIGVLGCGGRLDYDLRWCRQMVKRRNDLSLICGSD